MHQNQQLSAELWQRTSVAVINVPTRRTIIELMHRNTTGLMVRIDARPDVTRDVIARVEFHCPSERHAQAATMYAVGGVFSYIGDVVVQRPEDVVRLDEPASHVGSTWFEIDGRDTKRVLTYLFGDAISEGM